MKTWSSEGKGCYTWEERQESNWNRWGIVDTTDDYRLLILDFDLYKMDEKKRKEILAAYNEEGKETRVHKSTSGGMHLFYLVNPKDLDAEFDENGEATAKLPVKLRKEIDDKLNGYVVDPECEGYEIKTNMKPTIINPNTDLPDEWIERKKKIDTEQSEELEDDELKERLDFALKTDEKFKKLYNGKYKETGFDDRSSAEASLAAKIGYWFGRNEENIKKIMNSSNAQKWHERDDKSYRNSIVSVGLQGEEEYDGKDELSKETKKKIEKRIKDVDKLSWDSETEFITFTEDTELGDIKIEWGDTYELPKELAEELLEKKKGSYGIWKCDACRRNHYQEKKPYKCINEDNDDHKTNYDFIPLHPVSPEKMGDVLLNNYRFATIGETITESKPGRVHIYQDGIYHNDSAMATIRGKVKKMKHQSRQEDQRHVVNHIATLEYVPEKAFGLDNNEVVIEGGILILDTLEMEPYNPEKLALSKIPCKYNPEAECPKFLKFLKDTIPLKKDRELIQELLGTALINKKVHKRGIMIPGPTDAGKSTLCDILRGVFGEDSCGGHTPKAIADSNWARAKLRDILVNISDETSSGRIYNTYRLKKALDGNPLEADEKYSAIFNFRPTCEHIYGTNMTPTVSRSDEAFWNRWIVTPTRSEGVPKEEQNPKLAEEILEEEKNGIFNWIIEGYKRYMDGQEGFTHKIVWTKERDEWLNYGDSIQRFIQRCIYYEEGNKIKASDLHDVYRKFVSENSSLELENQRNLTKEVKKLSYVSYSTKFRFDGKQSSGFKHLGVKVDKNGTNGGSVDLTRILKKKKEKTHREIKSNSNSSPKPPNSKDTEPVSLKEDIEYSNQELFEVKRLLSDSLARTDEDISDELDMELKKVQQILSDLYGSNDVEKKPGPEKDAMFYHTTSDEEERD